MTPVRVEIDFVRRPSRLPLSGLLLLVVGSLVAYMTVTNYTEISTRSDLLEMNLGRYENDTSDVSTRVSNIDTSEITSAIQQLTTPWSLLLRDLESAAVDSGKEVALLEVAPDKNKRSVRIAGEARTIDQVLAYVRNLQSAESLRHPLLENHEVQQSDRDRPVRFVVVADWRLAQ